MRNTGSLKGRGCARAISSARRRCTSASPAALRGTRPIRSANHRRQARDYWPKAQIRTTATATVRWSGETVWGVQAVIDRVLAPLLVGLQLDPAKPLESIVELDRRMDTVVQHNWFAKSAIEMACWDVLGKAVGEPVYELLG